MTKLRTIQEYREAYTSGKLVSEKLKYQSPVTVRFETLLSQMHDNLVRRAEQLKAERAKGRDITGAEKALEADYALYQAGQEMLQEVENAFRQFVREHNKEVERLERQCWDTTKNFEALFTAYKGTANAEHILTKKLISTIENP